jgi:hypothetical protein
MKIMDSTEVNPPIYTEKYLDDYFYIWMMYHN